MVCCPSEIRNSNKSATTNNAASFSLRKFNCKSAGGEPNNLVKKGLGAVVFFGRNAQGGRCGVVTRR